MRFVARVVVIAAMTIASDASAAPSDPIFGLSISIASENGEHVRDDAWIQTQIANANELFAPAHISFRWTHEKQIPAALTEMHERKDRDALGDMADVKKTIDLFVVAKLEDVDEPGRYRKGVAWTRKSDGRRYVILSAEAPEKVLAHELGHFFGNPHTTVADNLMSYVRTGGTVSFSSDQIDVVGTFSKGFLGSGRLIDVGVPRLFL